MVNESVESSMENSMAFLSACSLLQFVDIFLITTTHWLDPSRTRCLIVMSLKERISICLRYNNFDFMQQYLITIFYSQRIESTCRMYSVSKFSSISMLRQYFHNLVYQQVHFDLYHGQIFVQYNLSAIAIQTGCCAFACTMEIVRNCIWN